MLFVGKTMPQFLLTYCFEFQDNVLCIYLIVSAKNAYRSNHTGLFLRQNQTWKCCFVESNFIDFILQPHLLLLSNRENFFRQSFPEGMVEVKKLTVVKIQLAKQFNSRLLTAMEKLNKNIVFQKKNEEITRGLSAFSRKRPASTAQKCWHNRQAWCNSQTNYKYHLNCLRHFYGVLDFITSTWKECYISIESTGKSLVHKLVQ